MKKIFCILLLAVPALAVAQSRWVGAHWVSTWASSPMLAEGANIPPAPGLAGSTLRQMVHVSIGGKQLRVRFSNAMGTGPLTFNSARIAPAASPSGVGPEHPLLFHGQSAVTIPAGALVYSDPIDFNLAPLADLVVTLAIKDVPKEITSHPASHATSYLQSGNSAQVPTEHWYFLNGIEVMAPETAAAKSPWVTP